MKQFNQLFSLNKWTLILLALVSSACQKSINESKPGMYRNEETLEMAESAITAYQFERISEHNFYRQRWRMEQVNIVNGVNIFSGSSDYVSIICGPEDNSDSRLIKGCVTMNLPTGTDPTLNRIRLWKGGYSGSRLADLTELKFSTYVVQNAPATMILQIDVNEDEVIDFNIFYNQLYLQNADFPSVVLNCWQQWDPLHQGVWRINNPKVPVPGSLANGGTIQQIIAAYPNARIIDVPPMGQDGEGIRFNIGGPLISFDNTIGYFDQLIIGTKNQQHSTLFDFTCSQ